MNQTGNNNQTELIKSIFYMIVGSTWTLDSLYLFLVTPMGLLGLMLNAVSFGIFISKQFRSHTLFKYLQVYTFNSMILSATLSCSFLISPRYLFDLSTSLSARIFKCYLVPSGIISFLSCVSPFTLKSNVINIQSEVVVSRRYLICLDQDMVRIR